MADFNGRNINDDHYINSPVIEEGLDVFLQELDILFNTKEETVLGDLDFGLNLGSFLWKTDNNSRYMSSYVKRKIYDSCYMASEFTVGVDMKILKGEIRDIGILEISIQGGPDGKTNKNIEYLLR